MSGNGDMNRVPAEECFQMIVRVPGREQRMFVMPLKSQVSGRPMPTEEVLGSQWPRLTRLALREIKRHFDAHPEE